MSTDLVRRATRAHGLIALGAVAGGLFAGGVGVATLVNRVEATPLWMRTDGPPGGPVEIWWRE
jgi:hypothetical protein